MLLIRLPLALVCFVVAVVLMFIPGPAFVFWILGLMLLGFSVGQILLSVRRGQRLLHRHVPASRRVVPRIRLRHMKAVLRNRWIRWLDGLSNNRDQRQRSRAARRAARRARG